MCYTELRMPTANGINENQIFRASPSYRGNPWFDWAVVRDPSYMQDNEHVDGYYIGQMLGFFSTSLQTLLPPNMKRT